MTAESSPRPWRMEEYGGDQPCCLVDADGNPVCVQYGSADAALIIEAVNGRDRLFDIVRRLTDEVEQMEELDTVVLTDRAKRIEALIREARAALGEDKP